MSDQIALATVTAQTATDLASLARLAARREHEAAGARARAERRRAAEERREAAAAEERQALARRARQRAAHVDAVARRRAVYGLARREAVAEAEADAALAAERRARKAARAKRKRLAKIQVAEEKAAERASSLRAARERQRAIDARLGAVAASVAVLPSEEDVARDRFHAALKAELASFREAKRKLHAKVRHGRLEDWDGAAFDDALRKLERSHVRRLKVLKRAREIEMANDGVARPKRKPHVPKPSLPAPVVRRVVGEEETQADAVAAGDDEQQAWADVCLYHRFPAATSELVMTMEKPGDVAVVTHDFIAEYAAQLTVHEGDHVLLACEGVPDTAWVYVDPISSSELLAGGYVPGSRLRVLSQFRSQEVKSQSGALGTLKARLEHAASPDGIVARKAAVDKWKRWDRRLNGHESESVSESGASSETGSGPTLDESGDGVIGGGSSHHSVCSGCGMLDGDGDDDGLILDNDDGLILDDDDGLILDDDDGLILDDDDGILLDDDDGILLDDDDGILLDDDDGILLDDEGSLLDGEGVLLDGDNNGAEDGADDDARVVLL
ncbi:uncharacterized protein AMSG_10866 [Thecamonas trahens ATCC 50062]|uniref:Uncharacterized protein n=1 Tax=Thecamonas trahens ATCC 50062 TaxID=461836 RepID=A0A0L0DSB7_THETB|nr:hypothetical protein AMSG_10866 [Thecamonas trahens ATCC 50062]KNC55234.1 hypothetical protein AMSG_10866 [Thecamonas trahens ATCC 50062]|eukprot:XP_013753163.1 hypothetical protein AMSG_10866 [Thecamonas trahens ATCC 50062]